LKHGINTPPLVIPRDAPFVEELVSAIKKTPRTQDIKNGVEGTRIWKFCPKTAYNIIDRAFGFYPHFFRLSRITNFFLKGWTIAKVHSWTGLSLRALDFYLGLVDVDRMGMSLSKK
jgi:hypothetical protein